MTLQIASTTCGSRSPDFVDDGDFQNDSGGNGGSPPGINFRKHLLPTNDLKRRRRLRISQPIPRMEAKVTRIGLIVR